MPSRNDLEGYCGETASVIFQLAALILDPQAARSVSDLAGHAGCAYRGSRISRVRCRAIWRAVSVSFRSIY